MNWIQAVSLLGLSATEMSKIDICLSQNCGDNYFNYYVKAFFTLVSVSIQ